MCFKRAGKVKALASKLQYGQSAVKCWHLPADVYLGNGLIDVARFSKAFVLQIEEHDVFGWGTGIPARSAWGPIYWAPDWAIVPRS